MAVIKINIFHDNPLSRKHQYSFQTGSRSCQVSNGIKGSIATDYAGLGLDYTGVLDIPFPFFTQSADEPKMVARMAASINRIVFMIHLSIYGYCCVVKSVPPRRVGVPSGAKCMWSINRPLGA